MEIGQSPIQRGILAEPGRNPVNMLKEGQIFSAKAVKLLPGQMAELAAFGQRITAQLEVPLQAGERYFFQVTSLEGEMRLKVVSDNALIQRTADQAAVLLEKLQLPVTKESAAFTALSVELGRPISKESIQTASAWLSKSGLEKGLETLRFMFSRNLPVTENVFQALLSARSTESLTGKLESLHNTLVKLGQAPEALSAISRLLPDRGTVQSVKAAVTETPEQIVSLLKNNASLSEPMPTIQRGMPPVQMMKEALVQLAARPVSPEAIASFKEAIAQSIPANHPERTAIMQQAAKLSDQLINRAQATDRQITHLFQLASSAAATVPEQASARMATLLGTDALPQEGPMQPLANGKEAAAALKDAFRFLGIDHEAVIATKHQPEAVQQNVKQELLKLMSETFPVPIREAAEQIVGRINAQHILSAESGPLQQLVMQMPVQFASFHGDVTIKWQGRKKQDGKIDADFCRVLFYVEMPKLKNTVIDMQVQNRIIHVNIVADAEPDSLKQLSNTALDSLKDSLQEQGYKLSGVQFKQPSDKEESQRSKSPLAQIMDDRDYLGVDIRI
ncbi:hypothetical protein [Domibacillus epiphyticus]|uniref:Flagellar hook-length control protein-like C-terminal domain-containing protein n=1 Tax=Domibacillus epiphyticus TaxID=1714355 RepID=A0A1V2ACQ7_9BACI|nr:hypothetical protein [Domibacillus epiphyticus]OMP68584.1 hypothetical protein BTO28_00615 [Domibacillus epiphyticus]